MALSVYGSSRWILECSALKLAVVFFWSNHHEPLPKTWREDDAAVSRLLSLAVGARGVCHVRHDGKLEIKRAMTFVLHPFGTVYAITLSLEI